MSFTGWQSNRRSKSDWQSNHKSKVILFGKWTFVQFDFQKVIWHHPIQLIFDNYPVLPLFVWHKSSGKLTIENSENCLFNLWSFTAAVVFSKACKVKINSKTSFRCFHIFKLDWGKFLMHEVFLENSAIRWNDAWLLCISL